MAEWIVTGEPSLDVYAFRATRFGNYYASPDYAAERTREGVKYYYRLHFPNDENEWARPHRVSPLHFRLQEMGAVFGEKFGWERVNFFQPGKPWRRAGADQHEWLSFLMVGHAAALPVPDALAADAAILKKPMLITRLHVQATTVESACVSSAGQI